MKTSIYTFSGTYKTWLYLRLLDLIIPSWALKARLLRHLGFSIGEDVKFGRSISIMGTGTKLTIGNNVFINNNVTFDGYGAIEIGNNVDVGMGVVMSTARHNPQCAEGENRGFLNDLDIHIKNNVWIAANAVILPGVTIGERSVVAAGAVVTKDVPSDVMVAGVPARIIKTLNQ